MLLQLEAPVARVCGLDTPSLLFLNLLYAYKEQGKLFRWWFFHN